jgi:integrase/recombinase XerD
MEPEGWRNPIDKVKPPKVPVEPIEPVSFETLKAMLATCEPRTFNGDRDRAVMLCLLDTGCRAAEFVALNLGDVNMATGAVMVRKGKGGKFRSVFIGNKARRELVRHSRHRVDPKPGDPL